jgi:putative oxidoreductase
MNMMRIERITWFALRVVVGLLFMQAGGTKLFGWLGGMPGGGTPPLMSQIWIGAVLEVFGGAAIMLGLFTRPIAFLLSGEMAVAYWQFHAPRGTWPGQNQGVPAVLLCFIFLYMMAKGGGDWSLDAVVHRLRHRQPASPPDPARATTTARP